MFDCDGSGKISSEELKKCLGCNIYYINIENEYYN
jgi:hypothetical protein